MSKTIRIRIMKTLIFTFSLMAAIGLPITADAKNGMTDIIMYVGEHYSAPGSIYEFKKIEVSDKSTVKINKEKSKYYKPDIIAQKPGKAKVTYYRKKSYIGDAVTTYNVTVKKPEFKYKLVDKNGKKIKSGVWRRWDLIPQDTVYMAGTVAPAKANAIDLKKSTVEFSGGSAWGHNSGIKRKNVTSQVKLLSVSGSPGALPEKGKDWSPTLEIQNNAGRAVSSDFLIEYYTKENDLIWIDSDRLVSVQPGTSTITPSALYVQGTMLDDFDHVKLTLVSWTSSGN